MSDPAFPSLPGLAFESSLAGSDSFARYREEQTSRFRTVERRLANASVASIASIDAFPANHQANHLAAVRAVYNVGDSSFLVYDESFAAVLPAQLHDRAWGPAARARVISDIALAIGELHSLGIAHGDLSPDAVLLTDDGHARLSALAPRTTASATLRSSPGNVRTFGPTLSRARATGGALAYLAPEQFMAGTAIVESDIFAWGCIAYEVATGRSPFGFLTDPTKLLEAIARGPAKAVHELSPSFTELFDHAVRSAMALDRTARTLPRPNAGQWVIEASEDAASSGAASATVTSARSTSWTVPAMVAFAALAAIGYFVVSR